MGHPRSPVRCAMDLSTLVHWVEVVSVNHLLTSADSEQRTSLELTV